MRSSSPVLCLVSLIVIACGQQQPAASPEPTVASSSTSALNNPGASDMSSATSASPASATTNAATNNEASGTSVTGASAASSPITADIEPRSNSKVSGKLTLTEAKDGVRVEVQVAGAKPGKHGIHFHENGDCSAPDATSAKGHYNPMNHQHGLPNVAERHLGDLGNIEIGADGTGKLDFMLQGANLTPSATNSLRGRALILHEKTDDGGQPVGNAGGRIGCAVIP